MAVLSIINNNNCSVYSPITWLVSFSHFLLNRYSLFDRNCFDMDNKKNAMKDDLSSFRARLFLKPVFIANYQHFCCLIEEDADNELGVVTDDGYGHGNSNMNVEPCKVN